MAGKNETMNKHLCGSPYNAEKACEHLLYAANDEQMAGKKKLQKYCVYCTAEGKTRTIGFMSTWTGCSPKWCPKRKELEGKS